MADIQDYETVIDSGDTKFFLAGVVDDDSPLNLNPLYWLYIKISPNGEFSGETELFVQKDSIVQFIEDYTNS